MIKFVDLKRQYTSIREEIDDAISSVIAGTAFIGGKYVQSFAGEFAKYIGVKHCITCGNGTDAIEIALKSLGIGNGDEVIVPTHTWISTSEAVTLVGAKPVFSDTLSYYYTINPHEIEKHITPATRAIIPVHLFGLPADMDPITLLAKKHKLFVLEDCAQAHGAKIDGKLAGTFGDIATFSFYPSKNLGAFGDAGCIVTNNDELAEKATLIANHGQLIKHEHKIEGRNSRLDGIQGAILTAKLKHLNDWNERRIVNAKIYFEYLKDIQQVRTPASIDGFTHVYYVYCIKALERDKLRQYLNSKGIETAIHYPKMLPMLDAYKHIEQSPDEFKMSYEYQPFILSLPMYPELTEEEIKYICDSIKEFYSK
ncbi:MAG: erythromycin biosynthesis sensory transduction protein eryC1 [Ignavibacteria bacterium GWB2_35_12]|nr:MAG: erythromycin biosynthesis sensory transduction protein eryC1 [Ignavibacteria bacterium GWA2_35_8]OGU39492.1 MAG: erythromycin biosynthesis sensory transduction protein eryC1 [Ignavibacteria bacterium GWB2_35_12]OGU90162.1 MAG: erythromycin biosynthesis sensory transduction protein eryC1 [Ignavibacteria bacterium RIFOXYA2_FULL_35_10]OGV21896.1 MAG: erythromycin biosynthesis sensory transduction protein eryC1 [Ignavibacteria bacterium RIFOXYC2_FULL_35_21]